MIFDKEEYWKRRNNSVPVLDDDGEPAKDDKGNEIKEPKPLRGQGEYPQPLVMPNPNSKAEIGFDNNGQMIVKNRAFRRRTVKLPDENVYTRKVMNKKERKEFRKKGRR